MYFSVNAPVVLIRFPARVCFRILPAVPPRISSEIPSEIAPRIRSKIYLAFPTEIPTRASFSDYSRFFFLGFLQQLSRISPGTSWISSEASFGIQEFVL